MARDMYGPMTGSSAWMMTAAWDAPYFLLMWAMWAAMMAAMMLPSASPFVLLYATAAARRASSGGASQLHALVGGYLLVWGLFSLAATTLQWLLGRSGLLTPMLEPAASAFAAALLLVAGVYQWSPLKRACLRWCRTPLSLLSSQRRDGAAGALALGAEHGTYCLGCCWALMLLLFAGGVMSLTVILALTALVAVEKLAPFGEQSARVSGALLVAAAGWVYLR
ncbi:MAG: DUF2182 domain-containing protein [Vicinamibacterales bacterium]